MNPLSADLERFITELYAKLDDEIFMCEANIKDSRFMAERFEFISRKRMVEGVKRWVGEWLLSYSTDRT